LRRAFAEHLRDGVSGNEVNEQKDQADYQPNDREGVEDALEDGFQAFVILSGARSKERAESKDPLTLAFSTISSGSF
jgi:hypothetical protein